VVGVAASRTKIFRNQKHRFQSKFAYCKLFGVYAGVIFGLGKFGEIRTSLFKTYGFHYITSYLI